MTDEQRKLFHARVRDISRQVKWAGEYISEEDFKRLFLAGAFGQKVVPNPIGEGFIVMNNRRSTGLPSSDTSDLIDMITAFGNEHLVKWSDPSEPPIEVYHHE